MSTLKGYNHRTVVILLLMATLSVCSFAQESRGFKFNNLSVSPFVNLEYAYDSNVYYTKEAAGDSILTVNPGVDLTYKGNDWGLTGNGWFAYDKYLDIDTLNATRYGESFEVYKETANGFRLVLGQKYLKSGQNDSLADGGRGLWRSRDELSFNSALSYQVSEKTSLTLTGVYSDLNYAKDPVKYYDLYGWSEWSLGLEGAYKITEKSNLLLNGGYQNYTSDGAKGISSGSTGYSLMAGIGSAATKKITYRILTGASWFQYAEGDQLVGWTYSLDSSWVINKKLVATIAGSSYFQPSEQEQNQATQVYALSTGLSYRPMGKLTTRFDISYRREENQFAVSSGGMNTEDRYSIRARADYQLMRYATVYLGAEYQDQLSDEDKYSFDRYRGTMGLSFRY